MTGQPVLGSLEWMNRSMRTVNPVLTTDRFGGVLIAQYSDETGYNPYTTEDGTADYTIEHYEPIRDLVRWM